MNHDLNDLLVFTRVVDEGSFTGAARSLSMPKSTVSRRVSKLEERLGARLLHRTTRRLALTDVGRAYYDRSARIVAEVEDAERAVMQLQSVPRGTLRFTAPVELALTLGPLVEGFLAAHPQVAVDLDLTGRYVNLVEEGYDLAIRAGRLSDSTLVARKLSSSPRVLVASPAYLDDRGEPATVDDLRDHDAVVFAPFARGARWRLEGPDGEVTVPVRGRLAANHFDVVKSAALAGLGIAQLPRLVCDPEIGSGALRVVLPGVHPPVGSLWVVYPSTRFLPPKTRAFVTWLTDHAAAFSP